MGILYAINELAEVLILIVGLEWLQRSYKTRKIFLILGMIFAWMLLCVLMLDVQEIFLLIRYALVCAYIFGMYRRSFVDMILKCMVLFMCVDVINFVLTFITYPIILVLGLDTSHVLSRWILIAIHVIGYIVILLFVKKRKPHLLWNFLGSAKKGIFIVCMVLETVFIAIRTEIFNQNNITIYLLWIAFIVFGITILTLWLRDRKKQHDKFSELIKYEHRTREIIPAIEKALQDLKNMGLTKAGEQRMIAELEAICKSDRSCLRGRNRQVRSFETTGSPILDNQLEQFVEECEENGILLDVIVRAEITAFLDLEDVEILTVLQIVGDLYRNAFKAVSKNKEKKNLLICFGYNANDYYEIGIYDNGHPFPSQIKEQLGVRGVTVDGTGHGMADVFEHLHRHQASFVLEENPAKGFTFTKGIHIVFDEKDRMEILS